MVFKGAEARHEMLVAQKDQLIQALGFDRAFETFRDGIALRNTGGATRDLNSDRFQDLPIFLAPLRVAIDYHVRLSTGKAIDSVSQLPCRLLDPLTIRGHGETAHLNQARAQLDQKESAVGDQPVPA